MTARSALVTGGTRGIGRGIAERLLSEGYRVVINGTRPADAVADVVDELSELGAVTYVAANIADSAAREHLVSETLRAVGRLDVLVNNAGITSPGRKDMLEATEDGLDLVLAVTLKGPFLLTQSLAKHMIEQREIDPEFLARIVNVTSISAVLATTNRCE